MGKCRGYLGTSKPMVCFLPETVMRATLGTTSLSVLLGAENRDHHDMTFTKATLGIFHKHMKKVNWWFSWTVVVQSAHGLNLPPCFYIFCGGGTLLRSLPRHSRPSWTRLPVIANPCLFISFGLHGWACRIALHLCASLTSWLTQG